MRTKQLEKRIEAVERELARVKTELENMSASMPWWERIAGHSKMIPFIKKLGSSGASIASRSGHTNPVAKESRLQMFVLDADHMSLLEWGGVDSAALRQRLAEVPDEDVATTIEEQMRGWMAYIGRAQSSRRQVQGYRIATQASGGGSYAQRYASTTCWRRVLVFDLTMIPKPGNPSSRTTRHSMGDPQRWNDATHADS